MAENEEQIPTLMVNCQIQREFQRMGLVEGKEGSYSLMMVMMMMVMMMMMDDDDNGR